MSDWSFKARFIRHRIAVTGAASKQWSEFVAACAPATLMCGYNVANPDFAYGLPSCAAEMTRVLERHSTNSRASFTRLDDGLGIEIIEPRRDPS